MMRLRELYREVVLEEKTPEGFVSLDNLIASAPKPTVKQEEADWFGDRSRDTFPRSHRFASRGAGFKIKRGLGNPAVSAVMSRSVASTLPGVLASNE